MVLVGVVSPDVTGMEPGNDQNVLRGNPSDVTSNASLVRARRMASV